MTKRFKILVLLSLSASALSLGSLLPLTISRHVSHEMDAEVVDSTIKVAVLNGCGREGLASQVSKQLRALGVDVVNGEGGNADSFDFETSVVIDRRRKKEQAELVARTLGISEILDEYSSNMYIIEDIVVIVGRDWDTLKLAKEAVAD